MKMESFCKFPNLSWFYHHPPKKRIVLSYSNVVLSVLIVFINNAAQVSSASLPVEYLPQIEILEVVTSHLNRSSSINLGIDRNSDVLIGEDTSPTSRILLKCNATYPVQWVYLGDGNPEFTTFTNVRWNEDPNEQMSFEAEASLGLLGFQGVLREEDTGNYSCRSIQEPTVHSYYYIYVPGDNLFAAANGTTITYVPKDSYVRIPCGVTHPKAAASLCKKDKKDKLICPVGGASGFNAKGGFLLNLKKQRDPSGTYVCTANYKSTVRIVEHILMKESDRPKPKPPSPVEPPPTFTPRGKNLCDPSPCGKQAECSVVDGRAVCYCFRGLSGNPYDECAPGRCRSSRDCPKGKFCRQGQCTSDPCNPSPCGKGGECTTVRGQSKCSCQRGFTGLPPNCVKSCSENFECSEDEACIKNICQSPCPGPCGQNAECRVLTKGSKRTAQCSCPTGLIGDPLKNCYKYNSTTPGPWNNCPPGYVGRPPACKQKECDADLDCLYGRKCVNHVCDQGFDPNCNDKCGHFAECRIVPGTNDPVCQCPSGTTGNPLVVCTSLTGSGDVSPTGSWGDPCNPNPCQSPAECRVVQGNRACVCPPGFYGDPSNCITTTAAAFPPPGSTGGARYEPCRHDGECRPDENCVEGRCQDLCNGICGYNAICEPPYQRKYRSIMSTAGSGKTKHDAEVRCSCPPGHEGNPYVSCIPIRNPPPPSPGAVPSATSPADPCFGSPCGRLAECTPYNNAPLCRCPQGFSGNPYVECRYPTLSPSSQGPTSDDAFTKPFPGKATPISPDELDFQGHSWGHHTDLNLNNEERNFIPQSPTRDNRNRDQFEPTVAAGSRFNSRPPFRDKSFPPPPTSSHIYDETPPSFPPSSSSSFSSQRPYPPTDLSPGETPTPKTLGRPMSPLAPIPPPWDDRDECSFRNPYADYDMDSCGVGRRCERDFRGIKRCVCISPFDCTGPTSIYHRGKCQTNRDCLLSDHICKNGTCVDPCSSRYSPCAGVAFAECRVIEGNVLCMCRRGYVGSPASGLDCRPKRGLSSSSDVFPSSVALKDRFGNRHLLVKFLNGTDQMVDVDSDNFYNNGYNISGGNGGIWTNTNNDTSSSNDDDEESNNVREGSFTGSDSESYDSNKDNSNDDDEEGDVIISSGSTKTSALGTGGTSNRHHRRHDKNHVGLEIEKETKQEVDLLYGHCGFGTGHNCDEKSHCLVVNDRPVCVCKTGYRGQFPNCAPECEKNEDCPENMACQYHQCADPCIEEKTYCAANAFCRVANHTAECVCEENFVGVPWIQCSKLGDEALKGDCMGFNCEKRNNNSSTKT